MEVRLISFAFGLGIPVASALVFNGRFLKQPAAVPELHSLTGLDESVGKFLEDDPDFTDFFTSLTTIVEIFVPRYYARYKEVPLIAIGCTGGQHRSVYLVEKLAKELKQLSWEVKIEHRELHKYVSNQGLLLPVQRG